MVESAFNNPTKVVGQMEYSIMRELNVNEIKEVNGGNPLVVMAVVYVGRKYGARSIGFLAGSLIAFFAEK
jgi:hypothetical protein